jgi:purine-cytosine permease-like protein
LAVHEVVELLLVLGVAALGYAFGSNISILPNPNAPTTGVNLAPFIFSMLLGALIWITLDTLIAFDQDRSAIRAPEFLGGGTIHLFFIPGMVIAYAYGMYLNSLNQQTSSVGFQNALLDLPRFAAFAWTLLVNNTGVSIAGVLFGVIFSIFIDTSLR